ncbi:hypothetical protein HDV00_010087 [Rhizophlyctis rosea]|nr:hypothetical protein HDV00_010087 [Rhizophlyctis rosea]
MLTSSTHPILDEPYPLTQEEIDSYQRDGHILLRNLLPPETVDDFRAAIVNAHAQLYEQLPETAKGNGDTTYDRAFTLKENLWEVDDHVKEFVFSKRFADIAAQLLGVPNVRLYHDLTFFKEGNQKNGGYTPWHQDGHYWPLDTPSCLTLWMPLTSCPKAKGPMSFACGTHLLRSAEHLEISDDSDALIRKLIEEEKIEVWEARDMDAGDATL